MSMMATEPDPLLKVGQALTAIVKLSADLPDQAENDATDPLMPGGRAMVALAPVANLEAWENMTDANQRHGREYTMPHLEDPDDEWSAFQILEYWAEQWRRFHGAEYGQKPTIVTEANFIRFQLQWAWDHLDAPTWTAFAKDMQRARTNLESVLYAGVRAERGVPCMYEECAGKLLIRKLVPTRDEDGGKMWVYSKWHCPSCKLSFDDEAYKLNVRAAAEQAKTEIIDGEVWCSVDWAAQTVGRQDSTIRVWVHRGEVAVAPELSGGRTGFVRLADVVERDETARRRKKAGRIA